MENVVGVFFAVSEKLDQYSAEVIHFPSLKACEAFSDFWVGKGESLGFVVKIAECVANV